MEFHKVAKPLMRFYYTDCPMNRLRLQKLANPIKISGQKRDVKEIAFTNVFNERNRKDKKEEKIYRHRNDSIHRNGRKLSRHIRLCRRRPLCVGHNGANAKWASPLAQWRIIARGGSVHPALTNECQNSNATSPCNFL